MVRLAGGLPPPQATRFLRRGERVWPPRFHHSAGGPGVLGITAYARLARIALLLNAATGLALFGWYQSAIYYHAGVGLFFLFVGFSRLESTYVRQMVGGF